MLFYYRKQKERAPGSLFLRHPLLFVIVLTTVYLGMDSELLKYANDHNLEETLVALILCIIFYGCIYIGETFRSDYTSERAGIPSWVKHPQIYARVGFLLYIVFAAIAIPLYYQYGEQWFPGLYTDYYPSQIVALIFIAPLMEELLFRYLLYDRFAKGKYKKWQAFIFSMIIFTVCHPVTSLRTFNLYLVPSFLLYAVYEELGIYGSLFIHMAFNLIVL